MFENKTNVQLCGILSLYIIFMRGGKNKNYNKTRAVPTRAGCDGFQFCIQSGYFVRRNNTLLGEKKKF